MFVGWLTTKMLKSSSFLKPRNSRQSRLVFDFSGGFCDWRVIQQGTLSTLGRGTGSWRCLSSFNFNSRHSAEAGNPGAHELSSKVIKFHVGKIAQCCDDSLNMFGVQSLPAPSLLRFDFTTLAYNCFILLQLYSKETFTPPKRD